MAHFLSDYQNMIQHIPDIVYTAVNPLPLIVESEWNSTYIALDILVKSIVLPEPQNPSAYSSSSPYILEYK